MQNQSTVTHGDQPVGHPWSISVFKLHFLLVRILNILFQVLCSQLLVKDSLSLQFL